MREEGLNKKLESLIYIAIYDIHKIFLQYVNHCLCIKTMSLSIYINQVPQ